MRRISFSFSMLALFGATSCLLLPRIVREPVTAVATNRPDFLASGIDYMPVGTAKQVARIKTVPTKRRS